MPEDQQPNRLGNYIKKILRERCITARELAEAIDVSESGMSRILNGQNKPRSKTLAKIAKYLARHSAEEQAIINAFHGADVLIPEEGLPFSSSSFQRYSQRLSEEAWAAKQQVVRVMEQRAQQADFRSVIEAELKNLGYTYRKDFAENGAATDFLVELPDGERWGIESRADIHRNLAQNFGFAFLVLERLDVNHVYMVTPYQANISRPKDMPDEITVIDFPRFVAFLHEKGAGKATKSSKAQENEQNDTNTG